MLFRRPPPPISDVDWAHVQRDFAVVASLPESAQARLRVMAARFLHTKSIEPVQGLVLDHCDRAAIAALACVPVLDLDLSAYDGWQSVVVYPGGFLARGEEVDAAGVVHEFEEARIGEAWLAGPVILSFEDVTRSGALDGHNVIIHEMAHKLDMLDGDANGHPPLHPGMDNERWYQVFSAAFEHANARLEAGCEPAIDAYAVESPTEFFAVTSEYFFELPRVLEDAYPELYGLLEAYYRPHRTRRMGAATRRT